MMVEKLGTNPIPLQIPLGKEDGFYGVVDLITMKAVVWDEESLGASYQYVSIPQEAAEAAARVPGEAVRKTLAPRRPLHGALSGRRGHRRSPHARDDQERDHRLKCVPVVCGAALRNKGIQPLLDAIVRYLPSPLDVPPVEGVDPATGETEHREAQPRRGPVRPCLQGRHGGRRKLVYIRIYSGTLKVGEDIYNVNLGKKEKVSRIYKIHANHKERMEEARAGAIVGIVGLKETSTGHTLVKNEADPPRAHRHVSACHLHGCRAEAERGPGEAPPVLQRIAEEDPTFIVRTDEDSYQTVVSGMGELHLDVVVRRIKEEFGIDLLVGKPQVVYKETDRAHGRRWSTSFEK